MQKNKYKQNKINLFFPLSLLLIAIMLLTRPYTGVRHDSILYFGQAFFELYPQEFTEDLFFKNGSQANFTFSHHIISFLLKYWTPEIVSIFLVGVGQTVFLLASLLAAQKIIKNKNLFLYSVIFLISMPGIYGAFNVFSYAEPFYTGRTFAESAVLIAIACALAEAWLLTILFLIIACLMHPLIAAPALILIYIWMCLCNKKYYSFLLFAPLIGVVVFFISPDFFLKIFSQYDDEWWAWIQDVNKNVFLKNWPLQTWAQLLIDAFVIVLAIRKKLFSSLLFAKSILITSAICFFVALIFSDLLRFVYAAGLQLWRVHWFLHWTALIVTPSILMVHWENRKISGELIKGYLLLAIVLLGAPTGIYTTSIAAILVCPLYFFWDKINVSKIFRKLIVLSVSLALFLNFIRFAFDFYTRNIGAEYSIFNFFSGVFLYPVVIVFIFISILIIFYKCSNNIKNIILIFVFLFSLAGIILGAINWDRRNEFSKFVEKNGNSKFNLFNVDLEKGRQIYWDNNLTAPWILLNRASYWNNLQAAGLLFNRGTAKIGFERSNKFKNIEFQSQICNIMNKASDDSTTCNPDAHLIIDLCQEPGTPLRYMVFENRFKLNYVSTWNILSDNKETKYYLYDCNNL